MPELATLSSEQRRALLAALAAGVFTRGRKGFYPGFVTSSYVQPFKGSSLDALAREGWLERDFSSGRYRLTDLGRIAAETLQREQVMAARHVRRAAPSIQPTRKAPASAPRTMRLPYAD